MCQAQMHWSVPQQHSPVQGQAFGSLAPGRDGFTGQSDLSENVPLPCTCKRYFGTRNDWQQSRCKGRRNFHTGLVRFKYDERSVGINMNLITDGHEEAR